MFPVIETLGGQKTVAEILHRRGQSVNPPAMKMWHREERRGLPGWVILRLMEECEARGLSYHSSDFQLVITEGGVSGESSVRASS